MRIRAEFLCPITYDLLSDPVIAADGNTYERVAIEKWVSKTQTSPLSGEKLEVSACVCMHACMHALCVLCAMQCGGWTAALCPAVLSFSCCRQH